MNEQTVSRPTDFGTTVRTLRKARGFSQRALADQLHVMGIKADVTYISKGENGKTAVLPSIALIRAITAVLATDPDHLLLLAGKIDAQALQRRIRHLPELGLLLWRLLDPDLTRDHILRLLALLPLATSDHHRGSALRLLRPRKGSSVYGCCGRFSPAQAALSRFDTARL